MSKPTLPREERERIANAICAEHYVGVKHKWWDELRRTILKHLPGGELEWELEPHVGSLCSGDYRISITAQGILLLEYCEPPGHWISIESGTNIDTLMLAAQEHADGDK